MNKEFGIVLAVWGIMLMVIFVAWAAGPQTNAMENSETSIIEVSEVASEPEESDTSEEQESIEESIPEVSEESLEESVEESVIEPPTYERVEVYYDVPMSKDLQKHIIMLCREHSIEPAIVFAMIDLESDFDPKEVGDGGDSRGLMQVQSKWHQKRMDKLGVTDLFDPYQNVKVGIDYLGEMNKKGKSIEWVLMAYNGGPRYANRKTKEGVVTKYAERVIRDSKLIRTYEEKIGE